MNLFTHVVNKTGPISSHELASLSGGEEQLIGTYSKVYPTSDKVGGNRKANHTLVRLLRALSPMGILEEVGEKMWQATPVTVAMTSEGISAGYRMV